MEVRVRQLPEKFNGKRWLTKPQKIVRLGDVGRWSMVRVHGSPQACPFVMSRKDWDKLPLSDVASEPANEQSERTGA